MSDQGAHEQQQQVYEDPLPPEENEPLAEEQVEAAVAQVAQWQRGHRDEAVIDVVNEFGAEVLRDDNGQSFAAEAHQRAQELNAPWLVQDARFLRALAAEARMDAQAAKAAYERSPEARIERIFRPGNGSRVLPW